MSNDIKNIRKNIDLIDSDIVDLLNKRAKEAVNISKEKHVLICGGFNTLRQTFEIAVIVSFQRDTAVFLSCLTYIITSTS